MTFAGQSAAAAKACYPQLGAESYYPTMTDVWNAAERGEAGAVILTGLTSRGGATEICHRLVGSALAGDRSLEIVGEVVVGYSCQLIGLPGTTLSSITTVLGHGSLRQCGPYLKEHLPHARVEMDAENSVAAARRVLAGSGEIAVVGTAALARTPGLTVVAHDVDDGSVGAWWLLSRVDQEPALEVDRVVAVLPADRHDQLRRLLDEASHEGFQSASVVGLRRTNVLADDLVIRFTAAEPVPSTRAVFARNGAEVLGAFGSTWLGVHPAENASQEVGA